MKSDEDKDKAFMEYMSYLDVASKQEKEDFYDGVYKITKRAEVFISIRIFLDEIKKSLPIVINEYEKLSKIQHHEAFYSNADFGKNSLEYLELIGHPNQNIHEEVINSIKYIYIISHEYIDEQEDWNEPFNRSLREKSLKTLKTTDYFNLKEFERLRKYNIPISFEWRRSDNDEVVSSVSVLPEDINSHFNDKNDYTTIVEGSKDSLSSISIGLFRRTLSYILKIFK
jgi:hypothetical protein